MDATRVHVFGRSVSKRWVGAVPKRQARTAWWWTRERPRQASRRQASQRGGQASWGRSRAPLHSPALILIPQSVTSLSFSFYGGLAFCVFTIFSIQNSIGKEQIQSSSEIRSTGGTRTPAPHTWSAMPRCYYLHGPQQRHVPARIPGRDDVTSFSPTSVCRVCTHASVHNTALYSKTRCNPQALTTLVKVLLCLTWID